METVREDGLHGGGVGVTLVPTTYVVLHTVFSPFFLHKVLRAAKCPYHHFYSEVACPLDIALKLRRFSRQISGGGQATSRKIDPLARVKA